MSGERMHKREREGERDTTREREKNVATMGGD